MKDARPMSMTGLKQSRALREQICTLSLMLAYVENFARNLPPRATVLTHRRWRHRVKKTKDSKASTENLLLSNGEALLLLVVR